MSKDSCSFDISDAFILIFLPFLAIAVIAFFCFPSTPTNPAMGAVLYQQSITAQKAGHLHAALRYAKKAVKVDPKGEAVGLHRLVNRVTTLEADIQAKESEIQKKRINAISKDGMLLYWWKTTSWSMKMLEFGFLVFVIMVAFRVHRKVAYFM